jgi:hypothetical protein
MENGVVVVGSRKSNSTRRHGRPPSVDQKVYIDCETADALRRAVAAGLPLDGIALWLSSPILADDSWRPIVEVLATSARAPGGMLSCSMPARQRLGDCVVEWKVRPPGRRHVHRWGAGHGGELRRCLVLGIGLSLSFRPGAQSPSVCTKRIDSLTSPFHSPSLPLPIQSHPEALPHHNLTSTTPAPARGPDSPSPPAVCNTVATSRLVSSRHPSPSLRPIGLDCGPPYATYRRHGIAKGARRAQTRRRLSPHI